MTRDSMTMERLAAIIAAYGARADRWPAAERDAAQAMLARSPEARALLAEATALDGLLDAVLALSSTPAMRAAVLATAPRGATRTLPKRLLDGWRGFLDDLGGWQVGPVLAASLVLGLLVGGVLSQDMTNTTESDLLQFAQLGDNFEGY
jgi:hypothetical protein